MFTGIMKRIQIRSKEDVDHERINKSKIAGCLCKPFLMQNVERFETNHLFGNSDTTMTFTIVLSSTS